MTTYRVRDRSDLSAVRYHLERREFPYAVTVTAGEKRTDAMNRTIHKWFSQIATHYGDRDILDVKADCNLRYGRPILVRDDREWSTAFGVIFGRLDHALTRRIVRTLDVPFTRRMTVKQLCEYMDMMQRDYRSEGVALIDPEARKYEGAQ